MERYADFSRLASLLNRLRLGSDDFALCFFVWVVTTGCARFLKRPLLAAAVFWVSSILCP